MNVSASYRNQEPTFRAGTYEGLVYFKYPSTATHEERMRIKAQDDLLVRTRGFNRRSVLDNAGNTKLTSAGIVANGGYPINDRTELFWTVIANSRKLERDGIYRFPNRDSLHA